MDDVVVVHKDCVVNCVLDRVQHTVPTAKHLINVCRVVTELRSKKTRGDFFVMALHVWLLFRLGPAQTEFLFLFFRCLQEIYNEPHRAFQYVDMS